MVVGQAGRPPSDQFLKPLDSGGTKRRRPGRITARTALKTSLAGHRCILCSSFHNKPDNRGASRSCRGNVAGRRELVLERASAVGIEPLRLTASSNPSQ